MFRAVGYAGCQRERECAFGRYSNYSLVREALHSQAVVRQGFVWMNSKKEILVRLPLWLWGYCRRVIRRTEVVISACIVCRLIAAGAAFGTVAMQNFAPPPKCDRSAQATVKLEFATCITVANEIEMTLI